MHRGAAARLAAGLRDRLRRARSATSPRRLPRSRCRGRPPAGAEERGSCGIVQDLKPFEHAYLCAATRHRDDDSTPGLAHGLHRGSGLRAVDVARGCRTGVGCADGGGQHPRRAADRLARAQHRAHRGRVPAAAGGFCLRGAHALPRHRALAARARARVAGRFRQGALHRPARAARASRAGPAPSARGSGCGRQQAGAQCAACMPHARGGRRQAA